MSNIVSRIWLFLMLVLVLAGCTTDRIDGYSEREAQLVLGKLGVSSRVLRPKSALRDAPTFGDKGFIFLLDGHPSVHVVLDRDYWVLALPNEQNETSYMLNPEDEQSALNITVGEDWYGSRPDADLAKDPGFTEIRRDSGTIANQSVIWRRWSDKYHLNSDCTVYLPARNDEMKKKYRVILEVTANTVERRKALEDHLASLQLIFRNK